nr:MAG TPA: hypothetical protein [Caudoviricetes sp.]
MFYCRADRLSLVRRCSGTTSSYKEGQDADKKIKDVRRCCFMFRNRFQFAVITVT